MASPNKICETNFIPEDLEEIINASQFLKKSLKGKQKRCMQSNNTSAANTSNSKTRKTNEDVEDCGETKTRQKIFRVMNRQLQSREQSNKNILKNLTEVVKHMEVDYNVLKENELKLEHLTSSFLKCVQQATAAHKQKLEAVQEIHAKFQKECADMEELQRSEIDKLGEEVEEDIKKLKESLICQTKRSGWETLKKSFIEAMQKDF